MSGDEEVTENLEVINISGRIASDPAPGNPTLPGNCQNCGRPSGTRTRCPKCMGYGVKSNKNKRARYRSQGRCPNCGVKTSNKLCDKCFQNSRRYRQKARHDCIAAYGGKCACCPETRVEFLQIDHVAVPGSVERQAAKANGLPASTYTRLKKQGFPPGYQVLCANCNMSLAFYGYCPHHPETTRPVRGRHVAHLSPTRDEPLLENVMFLSVPGPPPDPDLVGK